LGTKKVKQKRKRVKEIKDNQWYTIKIKGRTLKELIKAQSAMQLFEERRVSIDECLMACLQGVAKTRIIFQPQQNEK